MRSPRVREVSQLGSCHVWRGDVAVGCQPLATSSIGTVVADTTGAYGDGVRVCDKKKQNEWVLLYSIYFVVVALPYMRLWNTGKRQACEG